VSASLSIVVCAGCGAAAAPGDPYPFRCPNAGRGDDTDHVMTVVLDAARLNFPGEGPANPFVRYRTLSHSYHLGLGHSMTDADHVGLVEELNQAVAQVDGHGFAATPFFRSEALGARLGFARGGVWVKDETGNVSGSHKARHLMGLLIHLEVVERAGLTAGRGAGAPDLAIASCGNAALAAAVVARAGGRRLRVFVPTSADPVVLARLEALGAHLTICPREEGVPGDPTYHRLQQAVREGALPFTCQGPDNGLTIDGGKTLGYEIAADLAGGVAAPDGGAILDRLFIQTGGGALASAVIQGLGDAVRLGALTRMPRIHAVQTLGGHPLKRAYDRLLERVGAAPGSGSVPDSGPGSRERVEEALRYAAGHRSQFMWPWEEEPKSIAHGILDDETYDWLAVLRGMVTTGGTPVLVSEETLKEANALAQAATGISVDHTGSAGLAGLLHLHREGGVGPEERAAVLFTGVKR